MVHHSLLIPSGLGTLNNDSYPRRALLARDMRRIVDTTFFSLRLSIPVETEPARSKYQNCSLSPSTYSPSTWRLLPTAQRVSKAYWVRLGGWRDEGGALGGGGCRGLCRLDACVVSEAPMLSSRDRFVPPGEQS